MQAQEPSDQLYRGRIVKFRVQERQQAGQNLVAYSACTSVKRQSCLQDLGQE